MSIHVRQAGPQDLAFILDCNLRMAEETEDLGLRPEQLRAGIRYLESHPAEGLYLVATLDDAPAGTLMVTYEWSDWRNGRFWWIQSVYVTVQARRRGVYTAMHDHVRTLARQDDQACGIRLYVEQHNVSAQATYRQMGMAETHYRLYEEGFGS